MKRILVTGGSGFLGRRLKMHYPDWIFVSSKDFDLTKYSEAEKILTDIKPEYILHLAARVGGIKDNFNKQGEFFFKNVSINTNLLEAARVKKVNRVLSSLSTCAFPDIVENYPFKEEDLFLGNPSKYNFSYGYSKRMLQVQTLSYRNQYSLNYSTFCPSNIYGPGDNFGDENSHFVASLAYKISNAKDGQILEMWGTGKPLRQQLFIDDLCKLIPLLLEKHNTDIPIIVAPDENISIKEMCEIAKKISGKKVNFRFDRTLDGQYRKDGDNLKLKSMIKYFNFTTFKEGFKITLDSLGMTGG